VICVEARTPENPLLFHRGEILQGRVIEQIDDQHALLQIKGVDLLVENHIPLSKNMEGYFQVETTHPQVILKLIPGGDLIDQPILSWFKQYFSGDLLTEHLSEKLLSLYEMRNQGMPQEIRETLEHLLTLLRRFSFEPSFSLDPKHLEEVVTQSGLFFEHKLKHLIETSTKNQCDQIVTEDMKGLMIKLDAQLKSISSPGSLPGGNAALLEDIVDGLAKILHKIEGYQILNSSVSDSQDKIYLLLPLWIQNNLQFVEMNISLQRPDPHCSDPEEMSILFLLQLPEWGKINIAVKMKGKGLYCWFKVSNPEVSDFLSQAFSELTERFNQLGFLSQLNISVETTEEMTQSFFNEIGRETDALLNITV